jgi:AraC-like DNA-binding protein
MPSRESVLSSDRVYERRARALAKRRSQSQLLYAGRGGPARIQEGMTQDEVRHVAGRHEIVLGIRGRALIRTPRNEVHLSRKELLLIEPAVEHAEMPSDPAKVYALCWIELDKSYATIHHSSYSPQTGLAHGPFIELHGRTDLQSIAVAAGIELANRDLGWHLAALSLLQYLSCFLVRRIRSGRKTEAGLESPTVVDDPAAWEIVEKALEYCRANLHRQLRVSEVAQVVGYSTSRLSHVFSACIGQSIGDYARGLRVARARDLLEATDMTVSQIAAQIGYNEPTHFSRAFKRGQGVSPREYRARIRRL